jgi:hypothetical protein
MRAWSFGGSGDGPTPEQMETWRRRFTTPDNELPGGTAVEAYTAGFLAGFVSPKYTA